MVMVGQAKRLSEPVGWGRREWRILAAIVAVILVGSVIGAIVASGGRASTKGCVVVTGASTTGAAALTECGAQAREWCATALAPGAPTTTFTSQLEQGCRADGYYSRRR